MSATQDVSVWGPRPSLDVDHSHDHHVEQLAAKGPKSGHARMKTRQAEYESALRAPFAAISAEIRRGVGDRDIFAAGEQLADFSPDDLNPRDFRYLDPPQQHERFMTWLRRQQDKGVLTVIDRNGNPYVRDATHDGVRYAQRKLREAGVDVDMGTAQAFDQVVDARQLNLLYSRNFELLEGITADVSKEISRELTDGFAQGKNPREIARSLTGRIDSIGKTRAEHLARYEIMNSHNIGSISRYDSAGVEKVDILTSKPCPQCSEIAANNPHTLQEARGLVPAHPSCVCTPSPRVGSISA